MRRSRLQLIALVCVVSCGDLGSEISSPVAEAHIRVFVHTAQAPLPNKSVEILQTGELRKTDEGGLVEFKVLPGVYVVRAYDINRGGPCCGYIDFEVSLEPNETKVLDIVDCPECV